MIYNGENIQNKKKTGSKYMEWEGTVLEEDVKRLFKKETFEQRSTGWEIVNHIYIWQNNFRKKTSSKLRNTKTGRDQILEGQKGECGWTVVNKDKRVMG